MIVDDLRQLWASFSETQVEDIFWTARNFRCLGDGGWFDSLSLFLSLLEEHHSTILFSSGNAPQARVTADDRPKGAPAGIAIDPLRKAAKVLLRHCGSVSITKVARARMLLDVLFPVEPRLTMQNAETAVKRN